MLFAFRKFHLTHHPAIATTNALLIRLAKYEECGFTLGASRFQEIQGVCEAVPFDAGLKFCER
jgi:hypothetical protein